MLSSIKNSFIYRRSDIHLLEVNKVWMLKYHFMVLDVKPVITNLFCERSQKLGTKYESNLSDVVQQVAICCQERISGKD